MGCLTSILRAGVGLVLGVVIFVGFLTYLILSNVSDKLLTVEFYTDTIAAEDTYNRIYDKVLVDDELLEKTQEFLGDIQVVDHRDIVDLLREIIPPAYIQTEVEDAIERTIDYINEDAEELELYVNLGEPLENVKAVMFGYLDRRIDELQMEETQGFPDCIPDPIRGLADRYVEAFQGLAEGAVPESIPSLKQIATPCRAIVFKLAFGSLVDDTSLSDEVKQNLKDGKGDLKLPFAAGDTLEVLKVSARIMAEPLMDDAIARVSEDLGAGDRLDLIQQIGEWNPERSEAQLRDDIDKGRDWIAKASNFGDLTSLLMVIGGSVAMGLVFFPALSGMLRWPGLALLITGAFLFIAVKVAESEVSDRLTYAIETSADKVSDIPPSVTDLGGDILISFGSQLTEGCVGPTLTLLVIGVILFGSSFFTIILKRFIPFVK